MNALILLNYPLINQIHKGNIDLLKIQLDNMLKLFDKVYIISPRDDRKYDFGEKVVVTSSGFAGKKLYYLSPFGDLFHLIKTIKTKKIGLIRALSTSSGFLAVLAGKITHIPVVVSIHMDRALVSGKEKDGWFKNFLMDLVEGWTWRNASCVPAISKYIWTYATKVSRTDANFFLHYNFADTSLFKPITHKNKIPKIIYVSRLSKFYNVDYLLNAILLLKKQNMNIEICGDGPERTRLEDLSKKLNVSDCVKFRGYIDHEKELPQKLAESDLFVSIGGGFTIIESLACGVPVVGTDIEWTKEVLNDATGVLVENSSEGVAQGIKTALSRSYNTSEIRKFAEERFSLESWKERELEIYRKCLSI